VVIIIVFVGFLFLFFAFHGFGDIIGLFFLVIVTGRFLRHQDWPSRMQTYYVINSSNSSGLDNSSLPFVLSSLHSIPSLNLSYSQIWNIIIGPLYTSLISCLYRTFLWLHHVLRT
jgi:hypothetical protein